jgi:hypothetical protein
MAPPGEKASKTERELQAYSDEIGIRNHAERLQAISGADRAIEVLEEVARGIAARRQPPPPLITRPFRKI